MSLAADDAEFAAAAERLSPYGRALLAAAGREALRLAADEVDPEHLLIATLADEESAAYRAVVHAFADPETIAQETLALAAGILVVGSTGTLPFSPRAVEALFAARARAAAERATSLDGDRLFRAALEALPAEALAALAAAGLSSAAAEPAAPAAPAPPGEPAVLEEGPLFRATTDEARKLLSHAAKLADEGLRAERAIGPAHIVIAALDLDRERARRAGLSAGRARLALTGRTVDDARPPERALPPSESLVAFVARLPAEAGSLAMLATFASRGTAEVRHLLQRHRVTASLLERAALSFADPT